MGHETSPKNENLDMPKEVVIPKSEYVITHARSGGKGGQNVNKLETKAVLRFNVRESKTLTESQKKMMENYPPLANRMDNDSNVVLYEQSQRSQKQNNDLVIEKLNRFVNEAVTPQAERVPTKAPHSSRESRMKDKRATGEKKSGRGKMREWE